MSRGRPSCSEDGSGKTGGRRRNRELLMLLLLLLFALYLSKPRDAPP